MLTYQNNTVRTSVRRLVEFLLRTGDIEKGSGVRANPEAMVLGAKLHRKIQRAQKATYRSEVSLKMEWQEEDYLLVLEGRADGIDRVAWEPDREPEDSPARAEDQDVEKAPAQAEDRDFEKTPAQAEDRDFEKTPAQADSREQEESADQSESSNLVVIDEIKCLFQDVKELDQVQPLHLAQAKCYAFMYGSQEGLKQVGVQITYCNMETEEIRRFMEIYQMEDLRLWFDDLILSYRRWASFYVESIRKRNLSVQTLEFPFSYRKGQKKMMGLVHQSIEKGKPVFIQAPTGTGKTISAIYPTLKALGAGLGERAFYLTAKTITRLVAEDTLALLRDRGLELHGVAITAKDRICVREEVDCNPETCAYAKGHYDRINEALYAILSSGRAMGRELFCEYASLYQVCPYELSFEAAAWADVIICDYNYIFDPHVNRKSLFTDGRLGRDIFLIDEAHNLLDRARDMYSACLSREEFLLAKRIMKKRAPAIHRRMEACDKILRNLSKEMDGKWKSYDQVDVLYFPLFRLMGPLEDYLADKPEFEGREDLVRFYFTISHFFLILDHINEGYEIYGEGQGRAFRIHLFCIDPSENIQEYVDFSRTSVFFSATMFPVQYYRKLLGGEKINAYRLPSPFPGDRRVLAVAEDVTSRYSRRGEEMYRRILRYLEVTFEKMPGNYMVFFPSYQMMEAVAGLAADSSLFLLADLLVQEPSMNEEDREAFLDRFRQDGMDEKRPGRKMEDVPAGKEERDLAGKPVIGFCVLGSIFSEGIDLAGRALLGSLIVGTGLPMLCNEREVIRDYFDRTGGQGYNYAYRYPGVNKVLQAAGRVIRTAEDLGVLLLLDDRFLDQEYRGLLPEDWDKVYQVNEHNIGLLLEEFWAGWR